MAYSLQSSPSHLEHLMPALGSGRIGAKGVNDFARLAEDFRAFASGQPPENRAEQVSVGQPVGDEHVHLILGYHPASLAECGGSAKPAPIEPKRHAA